jgi:hypothetical protein
LNTWWLLVVARVVLGLVAEAVQAAIELPLDLQWLWVRQLLSQLELAARLLLPLALEHLVKVIVVIILHFQQLPQLEVVAAVVILRPLILV